VDSPTAHLSIYTQTELYKREVAVTVFTKLHMCGLELGLVLVSVLRYIQHLHFTAYIVSSKYDI